MDATSSSVRPAYRMRGGSVVTDGGSLKAVRDQVEAKLAGSVWAPKVLEEQCDEFFQGLGLPSYYFSSTPPAVIAQHISSLLGEWGGRGPGTWL
jgi:hypothetical protein